jgi:hypothetical protein
MRAEHSSAFFHYRNMKRTWSVLLALIFVGAPEAVRAQFSYSTNNGAIALGLYTGTGGSVVISNFVTRIGNAAFRYKYSLTGITIPGSVTNIGDYAFEYCSNLTSVTIPSSVTNIGESVFEYCSNLTNATISASVTNIGEDAFCGCAGLTGIVIPASVTSIEYQAFWNCSGLTNVTIPASVTSIGQYAFGGCFGLMSVTVPGSIEFGQVFPPSPFLTNVTIANGVTSIGVEEFAGCAGLTSVTIPATVTNLGEDTFEDCAGLTGVYFEGNAPAAGFATFASDNSKVYYLPGTTGWSNTYAGRPTAPWFLPNPLVLNNGPGFGLQGNTFSFTISWATNTSVVVEACTNLACPVWTPMLTNTLASGSSCFSEGLQTDVPGRFYRIRSP